MHESQSDDGNGLADRVSELSVPLETGLDEEHLDSVFGGAMVIGMGEASHGTKELFEARRCLTRELIEEHGVRLFAFEAAFSAVTPVNEYVQGGDGDPEALFSTSSINWPYRCESLVSFVEWIREFNEGRDPEEMVAVHGIDAVGYAAPAARLQTFLHDTGNEELVGDSLDYLAAVEAGEVDPDSITLDRLDSEAETAVSSLAMAFEDGAISGTDRSHVAYRHFTSLRAALKIRDDDTSLTREDVMADTLEWLVAHETDGRTVVWAHNDHLKRGELRPHGNGGPALGELLDQRFGAEYCPLGSEFGSGHVRIIAEGEEGFDYNTYEVESLGERSLPAVFGRASEEPFLLNVERSAEEPIIAEWFTESPRRRSVPASVDGFPTVVEADVPEEFDALLFVPESSPTELVAPVLPD